jgi:hypothetical protein
MFKLFKNKFTDKENQILDIINIFAQHPETSILTCPSTERYFLENKTLNYFIIISYRQLKITNHAFYYSNDIPGRVFDKLREIVVTEIKKQRDLLEQEIFSNENDLLLKIQTAINTY